MFVPGLQLSRDFYAEAVRPLLADVRHSAARIGPGSEVLGFDTARSADHEWGPRLEVFLSPAEAGRIPALDRRLADNTDLLTDPARRRAAAQAALAPAPERSAKPLS